ncbi:MAG: hypothetical protein WEB60_13255 [Terrimicrobiaceae bacterium]
MIWFDLTLVTLCVLGAVGYFVIPRFKAGRPGGCGSCETCPTKSPKPSAKASRVVRHRAR